jgi:hypothetical protein
MASELFFAFVFIGVGAFSFFNGVRFIRDPVYARDYVRGSSKAYLWRKLLGEEGAYRLTRAVFAPLGVALGLFFVVQGVMFLLGYDAGLIVSPSPPP